MIGKTPGNFDVSTSPGRGGMGEVYRAKDRKLGRDAAIKVLPEEFARDADRAARGRLTASVPTGIFLRGILRRLWYNLSIEISSIMRYSQ